MSKVSLPRMLDYPLVECSVYRISQNGNENMDCFPVIRVVPYLHPLMALVRGFGTFKGG